MRRIVSLVLVVMLVLGLCVVAAAAESDAHEIKVLEANATVNFNSEKQENLTVEVTGLPDGQYILLVLKADVKEDWTYTASDIATDNILYINQEAAVGGKLSFDNVFPKSITDSVIKIAGADYQKDVAVINAAEPPFVLGDVNGDGNVRANDAMLAAQIAAKMTPAVEVNEAAADVNGDGFVRANDAMKIAQYAAKIITEF